MSREAMQMALDMLNEIADDVYCDQKLEGVITALRQALETEQEPVAWMTHTDDLQPLFHKTRASALNWQTQPTPLYTAPQKQWVGLTDEEHDRIKSNYHNMTWTLEMFARAIEVKLKEKNHG